MLTDSDPNLAECAKTLLIKLEEGDSMGAMEALEAVNRVKDKVLFNEVGKLTRTLHDALINLDVDFDKINHEKNSSDQILRMSDASDRLQFVITTTEKAANKTMDMVEQTIPISEEIGETAKKLKTEWQKLINRELSAGEFRSLYSDIDSFLDFTSTKAEHIGMNLNTILLAQDFQDITGQVIKKVMTIVHEVETSLVDLVKMSSSLRFFADVDESSIGKKIEEQADEDKSINNELEGPIIDKSREDVAQNQDEVDDLLSSLGF